MVTFLSPGHPARRHAAAGLVALFAGLGAGAGMAAASTPGHAASNGQLAAFSSYAANGGTLHATAGGYGGDASSFAARVSGGSDLDFARGVFTVAWPQGARVTWGAAFNLGVRYHTARSGNVTLLRWDNYTPGSRRWDEDLVEVNVATNAASLVHIAISGATATQTRLAGPFALPVGRWFTLQVAQTLGAGSGARSSVTVDGRAVGSSTAPNLTGLAASSVRYGLVVVSDGAQHGRTALRFDRASASLVAPPSSSTTTGTTPTTPTTPTTTTPSAPTGTVSTPTPPPPTTGPQTVLSALTTAADAVTAFDYPYVYGGGHPHAGTASIGIPGPGYDGHTIGFDCSGAVAAVLAGAGLWPVGGPVPGDSRVISQLLAAGLIVPGAGSGPQEVTLFDDPGVHIFMRIDGRYFGTSDGGGGNRSQPNGGAGWLNDSAPDASSPSYIPYHVPVARLQGQYTPPAG